MTAFHNTRLIRLTSLLVLSLGFALFISSCSSMSPSGMRTSSANYLSAGGGVFGEYYRVPGMVYVPTGSMLIGSNDDGVFGNFFALKNRQVTINGFWMDEAEITNSFYRGFVKYTHDSVVASALKLYVRDAEVKSKATKAPNAKEQSPKAKGRTPVQANAKDVPKPTTAAAAKQADAPQADSALDYLAVSAVLQDVKNLQKLREAKIYFYNSAGKAYGPNYDNIKFRYYAFSLSQYAKSQSNVEFSESSLEKHYVLKDIRVMPDTTVWIKDISYSYNEPMATRYFSAINYSNYPVVGVTWDQAKAFCHWRTAQTKHLIMSNPRVAALAFDARFRLPTESEWEYAARGGRSSSLYPWGGPYTTNKLGCFLANFKNQRGVYMEDGYAYTCDVRNYWPNDFGLYNMAGNVAEWTESVYAEDGYVYFSDLNPSLSDVDLQVNGQKLSEEQKKLASAKKVIRGGSWKDVAAFIQNGYRMFEDKDQPRSYIGFRSVIDLPPASF